MRIRYVATGTPIRHELHTFVIPYRECTEFSAIEGTLREMRFHISSHAQAELRRRDISQSVLDSVLAAPEQKMPEHSNIVCYQSRVVSNNKPYLLRVMVNETKQPPVVVTVYRTSKITKYWSQT